MDEVRVPRLTKMMPDLGTFAQVSSDATRRLCEQGHCVTSAFSEWQSEVSQFVTHRVARNSDTMGRMAKCPTLPEAFAIQAQWVQEATDDYLKEMTKLMEVNSRIMGSLLESLGQTGVQSANRPNPSPAQVLRRAKLSSSESRCGTGVDAAQAAWPIAARA